jgi:hypothetical protein
MGERQNTWLLSDEILAALPLLGARTHAVDRDVVRQYQERNAPVQEWEKLPGIHVDNGGWGEEPRLVSGSPQRGRALGPDSRNVPVECVWDFSEHIAYFTDEVRELVEAHGAIRFIYGFS